MSSDSEESNASAHNEDVIAEHMGTSKSHSFAQLLDKEDSNGDIQNGTEQMELAHELEEGAQALALHVDAAVAAGGGLGDEAAQALHDLADQRRGGLGGQREHRRAHRIRACL